MLSKSPIKSPIQKISTAGTKLVTAASTAVQHGTQLSNAVKTKANNIAEDFAKVDELQRTSADTNSKKLSPNKRHQSKSSTTKKSPSRKSPNRNNVGSRGIRDRINMFESSDNIGGGYSPHRTAAAAASASRSIPEKENDTNSTSTLKEGKGYAFTSKDGVKKLSPVLRRKKKVKSPSRTSPTRSSSKSSEGERRDGNVATTKSPRKKNSPKKKLSPHKRNLYKLGEVDEEEEDTLLGEAINTSIEYDQQPNDMLSSRDERPMLGTRGKSESSTSSSSSSGMKRKSYQLDSINEDKPELNRSTSNKSAEGSAGLLFTTTSQKQTHHRCTTPILDNQIPTKFNSNERDNTKTQSHTLIQSPLRKHMKVVHDSACSGATCTIKQPFPLLLPNELNSAQKKQLELNELGGEAAVDGRSPYLDTLGNVCGTPGMVQRSKSDPTADNKTGDSRDNGEGREEGKEAALDLLSSAAFLFKTSRRKLI